MLIDWFTVGAQVLNFVVLVAVLKWALFDRVVAAMDAREDAIAGRMDAARQREADAAAEAEALRSRRRELEADRAVRIDQAEVEAAARRRELEAAARDEVDELRSAWEAALRRDRARFLDEVRRRTGEEICRLSRRALTDLADADLEAQVVRIAVGRLEAECGRLLELSAEAPGPVVVRTAFPMSTELEDLVTKTTAACLGTRTVDVTVTVDPELLCGLMVDMAGWSVGWSLDGYLDAVVDELDTLLPAPQGS